jgi:uncharacterized lipoprotein YajG
MNKKKLYNMKALFYLLPLVSLLVLAACAGQTPASIPRHECTPDCPADIQPDTVPGQAPKSTPSENVPRISIEELRQKMDSKADIVIVDNRSKGEYDMDHIKDSISLPLATIVAGEWTLPLDKELIFYCA